MPSLMFQIGANVAGFNSAMNAIKTKAASTGAEVGKNLKGQLAAALGAGAIMGAARSTLAMADNLQTMHERLGVSVEMLQRMNHVAIQSNTSIDAFAGAIEKINAARSDALADPNNAAAANLRELGVTGVDLANMRSEEILINKIGRALKTMDPQQAGAAFRGIFGRGAGEMIPALVAFDELAAGIRVASESSVASLAAMSDELDGLINQLKTEAIPLISKFMPLVTESIKAVTISIAAAKGFFASLGSGGSLLGSTVAAEVAALQSLARADAAGGSSAAAPNRRSAMDRFRASMADTAQAAGRGASPGGQSSGSNWSASRTASQNVGAFVSPLVLSIQRGQTTVMRTIARNTERTNQILSQATDTPVYE